MNRKSFFWLTAGIIIFLFLFTPNYIYAETTGELVKRQMEHIAKFINANKNRMTCQYGIVVGNILKGNSGYFSTNSINRSTNGAFQACEKNGGGCEELFTIGVHNDTPREIKIYVFHPWETDFSNSNALWNWTWSPGQGNNLGVNGALLFISKRFYLKAESPDGREWSTRRIENFGWAQRNYRDGQNLKIKLVQSD